MNGIFMCQTRQVIFPEKMQKTHAIPRGSFGIMSCLYRENWLSVENGRLTGYDVG